MRTVLTFILAVASASVASAQETPEDVRARELYRLGDDLYSHGRYEEALAAFEEAYELSERPLLLFNMANAQERSGHWEEAIVSLEAYLPHAEEDEQARIRNRLVSLRQRAERLRDLTDSNPEEPPEEPPRSLLGPLVIAGGGALLAGGVALAFVARGARSDLDDLCVQGEAGRICPRSAQSAERRDLRTSIVADSFFVAGAALVGVGLYFLLRKTDPEASDRVDASIGPGVAVARYQHAF